MILKLNLTKIKIFSTKNESKESKIVFRLLTKKIIPSLFPQVYYFQNISYLIKVSDLSSENYATFKIDFEYIACLPYLLPVQRLFKR